MKSIRAIRIVGGALVALASVGAQAQNGDAPSAPGTMSAPSARTDKAANRALQKSVRHALAKAKGLSVANISVRARDGAVLLQGSVTTQQQIDIATSVAQHVAGVRSVKNVLTVGSYGQ